MSFLTFLFFEHNCTSEITTSTTWPVWEITRGRRLVFFTVSCLIRIIQSPTYGPASFMENVHKSDLFLSPIHLEQCKQQVCVCMRGRLLTCGSFLSSSDRQSMALLKTSSTSFFSSSGDTQEEKHTEDLHTHTPLCTVYRLVLMFVLLRQAGKSIFHLSV